jgi:hypothetical protein
VNDEEDEASGIMESRIDRRSGKNNESRSRSLMKSFSR